MRSVLLTGGAGYFGRAFTRRLLAVGDVERICIYSRCEHRQAAMREEFGDDPRLRFFVGDVRDRDRLARAMEGVDVVVHAAALKRIEVGHYNPDEMVKTNVGGTMNVIDAAIATATVHSVVLLSSDKAYEPVSAYGQSKALAESLVLAANRTHGGSCRPRFAATRYGNVMGSTGSVIPRWRAFIARGEVVPVTDPNCTRFWMTVDEAVALVLDTIERMPAEPAIPELPGFCLGDLAMALGATAFRVTGLDRFEKRHESMRAGLSSDTAPRLTVAELRERLAHV
jgi:UDP-N-acetylglucosamine 4,6-dehydratase/5-epimerase